MKDEDNKTAGAIITWLCIIALVVLTIAIVRSCNSEEPDSVMQAKEACAPRVLDTYDEDGSFTCSRLRNNYARHYARP